MKSSRRIEEKRSLLNNILHREINLIGYILRINYLLHERRQITDNIERQITGVKRAGRRITQFFYDLRNRR